jgi:hypothetical protein
MSRKTRLGVGALGVALAALLASGAVAVAGGLDPTLGSPNHKSVGAGRPTLHVKVPQAAHDVFIAIQPNKRLKDGHLSGGCGVTKRCDYLLTTKHHGHVYYVKAAAGGFSGWWATTPGKYYWQAEYFTPGDTAFYFSKIGSFRIS